MAAGSSGFATGGSLTMSAGCSTATSSGSLSIATPAGKAGISGTISLATGTSLQPTPPRATAVRPSVNSSARADNSCLDEAVCASASFPRDEAVDDQIANHCSAGVRLCCPAHDHYAVQNTTTWKGGWHFRKPCSAGRSCGRRAGVKRTAAAAAAGQSAPILY